MADAEETPDDAAPGDFQRFACPGCSEEVDVPIQSAGRLVRCPYCNTDFFASHEQANELVVDDTSPKLAELDRESAFDQFRIQNYTALRMGAIRSRSWWLIGLVLAVLAGINLLIKAAVFVHDFHRWGIWPTACVLTAILTGFAARHAWRRAQDFKREIDQSALPEPTTPPDFSTLDNGSQRWKHLENIR